MKELNVTSAYKVVNYEELNPLQKKLVDEAKEATFRSYAPYSKFKVGAAIALDNGEIVVGSNQENAAYPSGTCAERTACYYAHARFPEAKFTAVAIAARDTNDRWSALPVSPCGACRQALVEYETLAEHNVEVLLVGEKDIYIIPSIRSLLPFAFTEF